MDVACSIVAPDWSYFDIKDRNVFCHLVWKGSNWFIPLPNFFRCLVLSSIYTDHQDECTSEPDTQDDELNNHVILDLFSVHFDWIMLSELIELDFLRKDLAFYKHHMSLTKVDRSWQNLRGKNSSKALEMTSMELQRVVLKTALTWVYEIRTSLYDDTYTKEVRRRICP